MRCVLQRVSHARVTVDGRVVGEIGQGSCALLGVARDDGLADAEWLARKVVEARIFEDGTGNMNRSLADVGGALLVVSQFTLLGDLRRGRRPSFDLAMRAEAAQPLIEAFCEVCRRVVSVQTGQFRAQMKVALVNEGPVTLLLDSQKSF
jgi:D-aminoacyl-tRNA deacylase